MIVQLLIFALLILVVPVIVGGLTVSVDRSLPFRWVGGQFLLWAGFQAICVPMVLAERELRELVILFSGFMASMALLSLAVSIRRRANAVFCAGREKKADEKKDNVAVFLWICVSALLLLQLLLAVLLAYEEGDDAFYVAVSAIAESSDTMYTALPYTGGATSIDIRHVLAPFPIWVAFLARVTGIRTVTMAQVALPVVLIMMSYTVYFLIGKQLFPDGGRKLPLFMLLLEVLILFGGYSLQSAENFLLVRTAQGKAVLADIIIPFLFLLFYNILEKLQQAGKTGAWIWLLTAAAVIAGCLCSMEGTLLACMLLGLAGMCMIVCYRRWKLVLPLAGCSVAPACVALLYLWLK